MPRFPSAKEERKHYRKHFIAVNEFGVGSAAEYLALAFAFSEADDWPVGLQECKRTCDNKFARFIETLGWFAVVREDRSELLTFYVLHPAGTLGLPLNYTHTFATNREYFDRDCICTARV